MWEYGVYSAKGGESDSFFFIFDSHCQYKQWALYALSQSIDGLLLVMLVSQNHHLMRKVERGIGVFFSPLILQQLRSISRTQKLRTFSRSCFWEKKKINRISFANNFCFSSHLIKNGFIHWINCSLIKMNIWIAAHLH